MIGVARAAAAVAILLVCSVPALAADCTKPEDGIGVSRIVEIDARNGPLYGDMSVYAREDSFLGPKEVVLTFDDGPMPAITKSILDTLDRFCTKATFFSVGRMAIAYPAMTKEVMARGHTLGTHTWSHPFYLKRGSIEKAQDEIERGFAAVAMAAGQPIAPFFRFPGLSDSNPMLAHLQSRGVAAFTVDVVSNDSYIGNPQRLTERTMHYTTARDGGILLFHDIKASTAKALPEILTQLKARGFKVVHMRAKAPYTPVPDYDTQLSAMLAKATQPAKSGATTKDKPALIPFTAAVPPEVASLSEATPPQSDVIAVTELAPEARPRGAAYTGSQGPRDRQQQVADTVDEPKGTKSRSGRSKRHRQPSEPDEPKRFYD